MSKKNAVKICKNLRRTIIKLQDQTFENNYIYKLEGWKPPRASINDLKKVFLRLVSKYKLKEITIPETDN